MVTHQQVGVIGFDGDVLNDNFVETSFEQPADQYGPTPEKAAEWSCFDHHKRDWASLFTKLRLIIS